MRGAVSVFAALSAAFCAFVSAAGAADAGTHLFEAVVPDGRTVVFLPAADVESPADAAAWLRWAGESLPGGRSRLRAVWDERIVELALRGAAAPGLLREGDDAVDPAGRVRFVLAETPPPDAETVRVKLAALPGRGEVSPEEVCLTNVWVLSRERFFARCLADADAGRFGAARAAIADMLAAGPARTGAPGGAAWLEALDDFCRANPRVEARFRFRNGGGDLLRVRVGGRVLDVPAGSHADYRPAPDATAVEWAAWSEPVRASDDDYEPEAGRRAWTRFGDDVEVAFDRPVGRLKPPPRLVLPAGAVPEELLARGSGLRADLLLAGGARTAASPQTDPAGRTFFESEPRKSVLGVRLSAPGWREAEFRLAVPSAPPRGSETTLAGDPMHRIEKPAEPVPEPAEKSAPAPAETAAPAPAVRAAPRRNVAAGDVPPWPAADDMDAAAECLATLLGRAGTEGEDGARAIAHLRALQGFWPVPGLEKDVVPVLRALTAHVALCPGCDRHDDASDPKREAFRLLGWPLADQRAFCDAALAKDGRFSWPWDTPMLRSLFVGNWRKECAAAVDSTDYNRREKGLEKAFRRWDGITNAGPSDDAAFKKAYRHVETCPGCEKCRALRRDVLDAPDFEKRREALFRGLLATAETKLTPKQTDEVLKEFRRKPAVAGREGGGR